MSDDTKTIPHSNVITDEENTLELMGLVFLVGLGYGGWVEMNGIISTSTNTKNTKKKKKRKTSLGPHNCKKKSQSKSVMDAGGGTGSIPFPTLSQRGQKKIKIWDRTQKHYLTKREKTVHPALPQKKKREKHKKYEHIEHGRGM